MYNRFIFKHLDLKAYTTALEIPFWNDNNVASAGYCWLTMADVAKDRLYDKLKYEKLLNIMQEDVYKFC